MSIFDFFKKTASTKSKENSSIRKIIEELEHFLPQDAKYIAAFSYLLGRVAHADLDISTEETQRMEDILRDLAHLAPDQATLIVQIAKSQNTLFGGTENYLVAREFKKISNPEQREDLLHCLFGVAEANEDIASHEEEEIRKIAKELGFQHQDFINVRLHYRDKLSVLKKPKG